MVFVSKKSIITSDFQFCPDFYPSYLVLFLFFNTFLQLPLLFCLTSLNLDFLQNSLSILLTLFFFCLPPHFCLLDSPSLKLGISKSLHPLTSKAPHLMLPVKNPPNSTFHSGRYYMLIQYRHYQCRHTHFHGPLSFKY